jgi:hypothetical protein
MREENGGDGTALIRPLASIPRQRASGDEAGDARSDVSRVYARKAADPEAPGRLSEKTGADFRLQSFHDAFLQEGFPPVKVIRRAMLGDDSPTL